VVNSHPLCRLSYRGTPKEFTGNLAFDDVFGKFQNS